MSLRAGASRSWGRAVVVGAWALGCAPQPAAGTTPAVTESAPSEAKLPSAGAAIVEAAAPVRTEASPAPAAAGLVFGHRATLEGKLVWKDATDLVRGVETPVKAPFLVLDHPIDVASDPSGSAPPASPETGQVEVHVGFRDSATYTAAKGAQGKHVRITGELSPRMTAHHFSPVVLLLSDPPDVKP